MATNAIIPSVTQRTAGTSAVALATATTLVARFIVANNSARKVYLGGSNVKTSSANGVKIASSATLSIDEYTGLGGKEFDLNQIYVIATAASTVVTVLKWTADK